MTLKPSNKPREFWIEPSCREAVSDTFDNWEMHFVYKPVHVIEKSYADKLEKALADLVEVIKKQYPCEIHDYEPNTTMDYFRCDKCGIIPNIDTALAQAKEILECLE